MSSIPGGTNDKKSACQCKRCKGHRKDPLEKKMATHFSILVEEIPCKRSQVGYSLWGCKELGMTEHTKMI